jgi:hypothetical protein
VSAQRPLKELHFEGPQCHQYRGKSTARVSDYRALDALANSLVESPDHLSRCALRSLPIDRPKWINQQRPQRLVRALTKFVQTDLHHILSVAGLVAVTAE